MKSFHCIVDKSGSMSILDKEIIVSNLKRTMNQVSEYLSKDEKFEIIDIDWDGKSESLFPLILEHKIEKFMLMTDGYGLDLYYNNLLKKKELQKNLFDAEVIGCIVLVGIDSNEERVPIIETFPAYCILEALNYVLQK